MSWTEWFLFILLIQIVHFLGTWKLYKVAGRHAWEAAIPIYNAVILMKIINRPWWWTILLFVPIVNLIMFPVVWVETLRSFGRNSTSDTAFVLITLGLYIYYVNYTQKVVHIKDRSLKPRTSTGEWVSSILFAVVAATIVHTYFMQPFTIPTSSLEKTLLVGDFLFVSKYHYGARAPMTPISFPMVHDTIPVVKTRSYLPKPQIPYFRFPGFQEIERNDIVVFSWPVDTLIDINPGTMRGSVQKPIDKKSNYVKRCVGLPGDSLEVRDGYVYINGQQNELPDRAKLQFGYQFATSKPLNPKFAAEQYNITDLYPLDDPPSYRVFQTHMTDEEYEKFKNYPNLDTIVKTGAPKGQFTKSVFPYDANYQWNNDHFGPIYIPKAGATVAITPESLPFYKRIIEVYEGSEIGIDNKITQSGTQIMLNGAALTEYTFKMDYYWMMGDNRNNSQDARTWGYVPFNHVVGKPVFVWMSWNTNGKGIANKIRWERMFTTVGGSGEPVSYFKYFLIAVIAWFGFDFFRKRRKKQKG
ncbi:signal peptidase I [Altibacter lentus]|uniref:signal peptidase I n=1 Tax=Altibacter lentus TaxID=1223410 RepID=UPI000551B455|nr:signal peptidase I [Altibacter lentus]